MSIVVQLSNLLSVLVSLSKVSVLSCFVFDCCASSSLVSTRVKKKKIFWSCFLLNTRGWFSSVFGAFVADLPCCLEVFKVLEIFEQKS